MGRALEEVYAQRLEEHAVELAEHFTQSTEAGDLAKAVKYGEIAAKRAISVYAYSEAVRLYEECLKAQEVLDPDDKARRCDLLLALGETLILAGEARRCVDEAAAEAFALAEAMSDRKRSFLASRLACRGLLGSGTAGALVTPEGKLWVERADRYAAPESVERVWADQYLAISVSLLGQIVEGRRILKHGVDLARPLGDDEAFLRLAGDWLARASPREDAAEQLTVAEEMMRRRHAGMSAIDLGRILVNLSAFFLSVGQRKRLEEVLGELQMLAERSRQANVRLDYMGSTAILATIDGRLEDAVDIVHRTLTIGSETDLIDYARMTTMLARGLYWALLKLGKAEEVLRITQDVPDSLLKQPVLATCLAHLGRDGEVDELLNKLVLANPEVGSTKDETIFDMDMLLLEAAALTGHREAVSLLLQRFARGSIPPFGPVRSVTCSLRILGAGKALLGRYEEARADYQEALRVSTEFRFRPEVALTRLQLAELLLEHYPAEKKAALEHLDFAVKEFREMKMQPSLERALRHKEILKA